MKALLQSVEEVDGVAIWEYNAHVFSGPNDQYQDTEKDIRRSAG